VRECASYSASVAKGFRQLRHLRLSGIWGPQTRLINFQSSTSYQVCVVTREHTSGIM
jgi:hypothetical protein